MAFIFSALLAGCSSSEPPKSKEQIAAENKASYEKEISKLSKENNIEFYQGVDIELANKISKALGKFDSIQSSKLTKDMVLDVKLKPYDTTNYLIMVRTAEKSFDILKELKETDVKEISRMDITQSIHLSDKYNNKSESEIYVLSYDYSDILKYNDDKDTSYYSYLRFAKFNAINRFGLESFAEFCGKNLNVVESFCTGK